MQQRRSQVSPDLLVGTSGLARADIKDDAVENRQPERARQFDDAWVREKLSEEFAQRGGCRRLRRAQIGNKYARAFGEAED